MLSRLLKVLAEACCASDATRTLAAAADRLVGFERRLLDGVDHAGLELTTLLIRERRVRRMLDADAELCAEHAVDPERFEQDAADYFEVQPPSYPDGAADAAAFRTWLELLG